MGSRAADKLKEIEQVRASLGAKLDEVERRLPLAGFGKKAVAAVAGSSVASTALAFAFRRVRGGRKKRKAKAKDVTTPVVSPVVTVNFVPKGAAWLAAAGLAAWAGYKVYDAVQRGKDGQSGLRARPSVVPMPEPGRQTGTIP